MNKRLIIVLLITTCCSQIVATPRPLTLTEREAVDHQIWSEAAIIQDENFFHVYSAILWNESRYRHHTYNRNIDGTVDFGIAQLNSKYWPHNKLHFGYDINTVLGNARVGAIIFRYLLVKYKYQYAKAICAYNCGPTRVDNNDIPKSTKIYAIRVLKRAIKSRILSNV